LTRSSIILAIWTIQLDAQGKLFESDKDSMYGMMSNCSEDVRQIDVVYLRLHVIYVRSREHGVFDILRLFVMVSNICTYFEDLYVE
jgi:hypothetical protein